MSIERSMKMPTIESGPTPEPPQVRSDGVGTLVELRGR